MITLQDVYDTWEKWLYFKDLRVLDTILAVAVSRQILREYGGDKLWLIIVGPSGCGKNELIRSLNKMEKTVYELPRITSKTLVSGFRGAKDLAPELNDKLVTVPEGTRILGLHGEEKKLLMGQFRDLYDGIAGRITGSGKRGQLYTNLKVTMLWGAVPQVEREILFHSELGTRFLMFRMILGREEREMNMQKLRDKGKARIMRKELLDVMYKFVRSRERMKLWKEVGIPENIEKELQSKAQTLAVMRASVSNIDYHRGVPIGEPVKERPNRILNQFRRLYISLKSLEKDYPDDRALAIIDHMASSSGDRIRTQVLDLMINCNPVNLLPTSEIANELRKPYVVVRPQLYILWSLGMVEKEETKVTDAIGREKVVEAWKLSSRLIPRKETTASIDKYFKGNKTEVKML